MRLFTAVLLPEEVREAVRRAFDDEVARQFPDPRTVRAVAPENLHVTVRFLGDVQPEALPEIREALLAAAGAVPASQATVRVRGFGVFPPRGAPRVLWAGIDDPAGTISTLEREVTRRLEPLGFPPEDRPYTAHVTVARVQDDRRRRRRGPASPDPPRPLVLPADLPLGPAFAVDLLSLVASELTPSGGPLARSRTGPSRYAKVRTVSVVPGPRYRTLGRFPLSPHNPQE